MDFFEIAVEIGTVLVVAGLLLKRRSEAEALEAELVPVPVRSRH